MCSGWRGKSHVCDEAEVGAGAGDRDVSGGGASSVVIYTPILMELFFYCAFAPITVEQYTIIPQIRPSSAFKRDATNKVHRDLQETVPRILANATALAQLQTGWRHLR